MKRLVVLCLLLTGGLLSYGQTFNEWFRQKRTQRKYLIEQIAALKVYEGFVKTGYKIVSGGLNVIGDFKNGDFKLHKRYFDDLVTVNPQIKRYAKIGEVIGKQVELVKLSQHTIRDLRKSGMLKEEELLYIKRVMDRAIDQAIILLDELSMLISDGQLSLKDDERLRRIDEVDYETSELCEFITSYANEAKQLALMRKQEEEEIRRIRRYYGIIE